jgi:death-on-curing protein
MRYLTVAQILRIHERLIDRSGGERTVRDLGLIESAVAQPRMSFDGNPLYPSLADKAAALAYSLNKNHGFADGNKRVSHAAMEMFLIRSVYEIEVPVDEQEAIFLRLAAGDLDRVTFTEWVRSHMTRRR